LKIKKLCCIVLANLIFSCSVALAEFSDVGVDAWYYECVNEVSELGLYGYEDGTFRPEDKISREEFVTAVKNITGNSEIDEELINYETNEITRQRAAIIISRTLKLPDAENSISENITDWEKTCPKCKEDIAKCYAAGIMQGYEDGSFKGRYPITRAEAAAFLLKAYQYQERE